MSQVKENSMEKSLVFILSRFGQVVGVYSSLDNLFNAIQDCVSKGVVFDVSSKFVF